MKTKFLFMRLIQRPFVEVSLEKNLYGDFLRVRCNKTGFFKDIPYMELLDLGSAPPRNLPDFRDYLRYHFFKRIYSARKP